MESVSECSQHQKRKLVTHGLEDQKRVSGRTFFCPLACGAGIAKRVLESPGSRHSVLWPIMLVCLSLVKEAERWLMTCRVLGWKP